MSEYTNFEIGQKFPLPIATQADGAMFQVDANGAMFILLAHGRHRARGLPHG